MKKRSKKLAIIQSNYIPWKGYFDIINIADEFIFFDHVQYTKNDWRNRNRIKTPHGVQWITIPVYHRNKQKISEIRTSGLRWRKKHWSTLKQNYSKAPFFKRYKPIFEELYLNSKTEMLSRINYEFIIAINKILNINTKMVYSTDYQIDEGKTECLISLCEQSGSQIYISGPRGKNYIEEKLFYENNIEIYWMDYSDYAEYDQLYPDFYHDVTILDLIFNVGPNAYKYMKSFK